jgi:hypothetical protein
MTVGTISPLKETSHQSMQKKSWKSSRKMRPHAWNPNENEMYLSFIAVNADLMKRQDGKRKRVFVWMAKVITTRTSSQIKAHHQKLERKYSSVEAIIRHLQETCQFTMAEDAGKMVTIEAGVQCDLEQEDAWRTSEK